MKNHKITPFLTAILLWLTLASCTNQTQSPAETPVTKPSPTILHTETPEATPSTPIITPAITPDFTGLTPPPLLPEMPPQREIFFTYPDDCIDSYGNPPIVTDWEGRTISLLEGTIAVKTDVQTPWLWYYHEGWPVKFPAAFTKDCYLLITEEKLAIMTLEGEILTDFVYDYILAGDVYGPRHYYSVNGYLLVQRAKEGDMYREHLFGVFNLQTGDECIPTVYKQLDLYDGFLYAIDEDDVEMILDYQGEIICRLAGRNMTLQDYIDFVNTARAEIGRDVYGAVLGKKPYIDAILERVQQRKLIGALISSIDDDEELVKRVLKYEKDKEYNSSLFLKPADEVVKNHFHGTAAEEHGREFGGLYVNEVIISHRIVDLSLYKDCTKRFLADRKLVPIIQSIEGDLQDSWVYNWHSDAFMQSLEDGGESLRTFLNETEALEAALMAYRDGLGE